MHVREITALLPEAQRLLADYGLNCAGCSMGGMETLEEGCRMHGFEEEDIDVLVEDLNELLSEKPARPQTLTLTLEAAQALRGIADREGKLGEFLEVTFDEAGSFCLEFRKEKNADDYEFSNSEVADIRLLASALTLMRLGGSMIDFREGRFKLDMAENGVCGCEKGGCGCDAE